MLIYFDESYDYQHKYLILGALFNPHSKFLHRELKDIKKKYKFYYSDGKPKEIKYRDVLTDYHHKVASAAIASFAKSTSWFRCIVIEQSKVNYDYFGSRSDPLKMKKARAYKKYAEMLIGYNTQDIVNGVLLCDNLSRCNGDKFVEVMKESFSNPGINHSEDKSSPTLKEIKEVHSHVESYQVVQVCDLLTGCVLNSLVPAKNKYKNNIRKYLKATLKIPSFDKTFWKKYPKWQLDVYYPKFNIWFWEPKR